MATQQLRALTDLSLRKEPRADCEEWLEGKAGQVFTPPPHFRIDKALERGIVEIVEEKVKHG